MNDEERNFHLLASLVNDTSADILLTFLNKKLEIANTCLPAFLLAERHTFYHLLTENECCSCTANTRTGRKCMFPAQWSYLYRRNGPSCRRHAECICQYNVQANVKSSEFDISLSTILLLNSNTLNTIESEKCHIRRIRKHRNELAHNTSRKIDNISFQISWNEVTLSVTQLARACSLQLAVQTEEKINLTRTPQLSYQAMAKICDAYPKCVTSVEHENERGLIIETSIGAVHEAVERMNECITPVLQQRVTHDIARIRARLLNDEYKHFIISYMDANIVIESLRHKRLFTESDAQQLLNIEDMRSRSEQLLQTIHSKDDAVVDVFLHSLLETQQTLIHNFIQGSDNRSKLRMILEFDIPQPHPVGVDMSLHIKLRNRFDLESKILDVLRREADEINELTRRFSNMSLRDVEQGSIIIRLKSENPKAIENSYKAFLNGRLRGLIEDILKMSGVLDELIHDQVTVAVKISIDGTHREPTTFYERSWTFLVEELSPRPVAALLYERGVLNNADIQEIFHVDNITRFSQSHSLIQKLNFKCNETLVDFKQCLSLTSQSYILRNTIGIENKERPPPRPKRVKTPSDKTPNRPPVIPRRPIIFSTRTSPTEAIYAEAVLLDDEKERGYGTVPTKESVIAKVPEKVRKSVKILQNDLLDFVSKKSATNRQELLDLHDQAQKDITSTSSMGYAMIDVNNITSEKSGIRSKRESIRNQYRTSKLEDCDDHDYDYPDISAMKKKILERKSSGQNTQTDFQKQFQTLSSIDLCKLLSKCHMETLARVCYQETLDGSFFTNISDDELKDTFPFNNIQLKKFKKIRDEGWLPK